MFDGQNSHVARSVKGNEITIDLAPAAVAATAVAAGDAAVSAPDLTEAPAVEPDAVAAEPPDMSLPVEAEAAPAEPAEALPQPPVEASVLPPAVAPDDVVVAVAPTEVVQAEDVPPPTPPPAPTAERKPEHRKVERKRAARKPVSHAAQAASAQSGQNDVGGTAARADPSEISAYVGRLRAWLERHKRYPAAARASRAEGVVTVRFVVARDGHILTSSIARSSGSTELDQAALGLLREADPVPPVPPTLPQARLSVSAPIRYAIR